MHANLLKLDPSPNQDHRELAFEEPPPALDRMTEEKSPLIKFEPVDHPDEDEIAVEQATPDPANACSLWKRATPRPPVRFR